MNASISIATPVGPFFISVAEGRVVRSTFRLLEHPESGEPDAKDLEVLALAKREVEEYFRGERKGFTVPLGLAGTPFQVSVWKEAKSIPFGQTITYGEMARRIKNPRASRAVGNALGANPTGLFIPCHRIVPASRGVGGFGSGPKIKAALLALEKKLR